MADDRQLLNSITETADMAISSLNHVKVRTDDQALIGAIDQQVKEYEQNYGQATAMLHGMGNNPMVGATVAVAVAIEESFK